MTVIIRQRGQVNTEEKVQCHIQSSTGKSALKARLKFSLGCVALDQLRLLPGIRNYLMKRILCRLQRALKANEKCY